MGVVTGLRLVDVIPLSDSSETNDNSEPSVAVDPLNTNEIVAGAFGFFSGGVSTDPYFTSINGGTAWTDYGDLHHNDKTLAWSQDGSTLFTATLLELTSTTAEINTYSGTIGGSDFGSPINTYDPTADLDQPWIRTGPSDHVYVAYNNFDDSPTAHVLVSSNGGVDYTSAALDRLSDSILQDAPAVRLAVNGATVYGAFTRWTSVLDSNADETRYNADVYVVRSDDGGATGFAALGSGGLGVNVASPVGWYANTSDKSLTLGRNRTGTGTELAIAVDPTNANHVVIAYGTAPGTSGTIDSGELGLVIAESTSGGSSWTQKFATPVTSGGIKSSIPALAIAADGMIAMLYCSYDPSTDELSQHLLTTNDDFATTSDMTLATESNTAAPFDVIPYLGDFYDITCIGNTFFGIFSAANADNGTDASFSNVTLQRSFTGTAGTSNFQLTTSSGGSPVSASIDPFFFSFTAAITISSGTTIVSSATNESYIVLGSGTLEVASGGTVSGEITISSGGSVLVDSGGTVLDTLISSGGSATVSAGGLADPTTVFSGGTEIVSAGGTDSGALISGGEQDVFGVATGATIFSGGSQVVESGASASGTVVSSGGELIVHSGGTATSATIKPGGVEINTNGSGGSGSRVTNLRIVDIIPVSDSSETNENSEPSVAVDPLNTKELVAGAFGTFATNPSQNPFFTTVNGGTTWADYGNLSHNDKTLAWSTDGSTLFAATMLELGGNTSKINTYSGTISGSDFGSPINTYNPSRNLDQPWIATGGVDQVYVAYNDITSTGVDTANVLVSSNGGVDYTSGALDRNSGSIIQDAPAVRLAVNGATVYGAFTRWTSVLDFNGPTVSSSTEKRYNAEVYVVRSDDGGATGFAALGSGGLGVEVATPIGWFANTINDSLTLGRNRTGTGTELAIAVDPTNANHVLIAYGNAPGTSGTINSGELGLVIAESTSGGSSWTQKYATPVTSGGIKSSMPALAIAADGMIAMLYCSYDPSTDELSQHLLTTSDDFATTSNMTLATESNTAAPFAFNPYLGDFYNLTCIGNTFFGIFTAANADNGTDASFSNVTLQRSFTGTAGTSNFQLTTSSGGSPVSASIDPFFFSFLAAITVSSGTTIVSSATNESYIVLGSGTLEVASGGTASQEIIISSGGSVLVDSGGAVLDTLISSGGSATVSSGGSATSTTISSGGTEIVSGGGTDLAAVISGGGVQDVFGSASGATIFSGGSELVESGGKVTDTTVSSGGTLGVLSGGTADPTVISSGGTEIVSGGGTDLGALISGGEQDVFGFASGATVFTGSQVIESGGSASSTTASSGGTEIIITGGLAISTTVHGGSEVLSGGTASGTTLSSGFETISSGGTAISTSIGIFGEQVVLSGGIARGTNVRPGGLEAVDSGGITSNTVVSSAGVLNVLFGGLADPTTILSGGTETINFGGTDLGALISGGTQNVFGYASGATVLSGGLQKVESGGIASATTISSGVGGEVISGGGTDLGALISSGGLQAVFGYASGARVFNSGSQVIHSGGTASNTTVSSGGVEDVLSGGRANGTTLIGFATSQEIFSGGLASGTTVNFGGLEEVDSGGTDLGAQLSGGEQDVAGYASGATVLSGGAQGVGLGGTASATIVSSGGTLAVVSNGVADLATILSGGTEIVLNGGGDLDAQISGGEQDVSGAVGDFGFAVSATIFTGSQVVFSGGFTNGTVISGGTELVSSGGTALATIVNSGGTLAVASRGVATDGGLDITTIFSGGTEVVSAGGSDRGARISGGKVDVFGTATSDTIFTGSQLVESGGTASNTIVSGGTLRVLSGGLADPATIFSGGSEIVSAGGTDFGAHISGGMQTVFGLASGATAFSGGNQTVSSGGTASSTTVSSGGFEVVFGSARGTIIDPGGFAFVSSGGTGSGAIVDGGVEFVYGAAGGTIVNSGSQYIQSGGSGTIVNSGGADIVSGSISGTLINSGGVEDDKGIARGAQVNNGGLQIVESGALASGTVASGTGAQLLVLSGGTASGTTLSAGGFDVVRGSAVSTTINNGGIEDDQALASGAQVKAGGLQIADVGGTASATVVSGTGAQLLVVSGGAASGATLSAGGFDVVNSGGTAVSTTINSGGIEDDKGVARGAQVNSGGLEIADSGGTASGTTVMRGGQLFVA